MIPSKYTKPERIKLKGNSDLNELWVKDRIAEDPCILGLGQIVVRDRERPQPRAGILDILCQDVETDTRYEIEVQLGKTDESHIIRTIEYWDIERKRYPQYDHVAVIVAEEITSRFLNVISLFNGVIPLVAIQMQALRVGEHMSLVFTTVLNEMQLGLVDEDEEVQVPADRQYWEKRANRSTLAITDDLFNLITEVVPGWQLKYNQGYIGLASPAGKANNFVSFNPKKEFVRLAIRLEQSDEIAGELEKSGLDVMGYTRWGAYQIRIFPGDVTKHRDLIKKLMIQAYESAHG